MNEQSLRDLIEHTRYNDTESVKSSLGKISNLPEGTDITPLLDALSSDNTNIRKFAAEALGLIKNETSVNHLIKALNDKSIYVRKLSADALGNIGSKTAVPHLIQIINDENIYVRWAIAEAFGKIKDRTTVPYLIDLLNDQSAYVRWASAKALGNIEDSRAIIHLKKLLEDEDSLVKVTAKSVLNKFEEMTEKELQEDSSLESDDTIALPAVPQKKKDKKKIKNKLLSQKKEIMELLSKSKTKNLDNPMAKETEREEGKLKIKHIKDKMLSVNHLAHLNKSKETKKLPFKEVIDLYARKKYDTNNLPIEQVMELLSTHDIKLLPLKEKDEITGLAKDGNIKSFESIVNAIDSFISDLNTEENEGEQKEDSFDELFGLIDYIIDELEEDKAIITPEQQIETSGEITIIEEEKEPVSEKKEKETYWKSTPTVGTRKGEETIIKEEKEPVSEKKEKESYRVSTPDGIIKKKVEEKYPSVRIPLAEKKIFPAKTEELLSDTEEKPAEKIKEEITEEKPAEKIKEEITEEKPVRGIYETTGEKEIKLPDEQSCPVCLKKLITGKKFCIYCGYKIVKEEIPEQQEEENFLENILEYKSLKEEVPDEHIKPLKEEKPLDEHIKPPKEEKLLDEHIKPPKEEKLLDEHIKPPKEEKLLDEHIKPPKEEKLLDEHIKPPKEEKLLDEHIKPPKEEKPLEEHIKPPKEEKLLDEHIKPPKEEKLLDEHIKPPKEEKLLDEHIKPPKEEKLLDEHIKPPKEEKPLDEYINKYIKDLNNTSSLVRLKAVIKLGETGSEEASEALIAKLKNGDKEDIRWRIIESLGKLKKSNSVEVLINFLKTEIPDIKIKIIETLAILGDKRAAKPVTEELKSEVSVKLAAIEALGMLGDKEIVPELIRELEDRDPTVRIRTVEALGKLGDKRAIEPIKNARKKEGIFSIIMKSNMTSIIKKLESN